MNKTTELLTVTVPLSFEAHSLAQEYGSSLSNLQKAKQVYLNTLAVYAVDHYLRCLGFETDWQSSDSRNQLMLKLMDVADLNIKQVGKLECRPVLPEAEICEIPPEVWSDRIGYVAVQLNPSLKEATILGFSQKAAAEVFLSQLQSLEDFLVYLSNIEQAQSLSIPQSEPSIIVKLGQWFEGIIEADWQTIDKLLNPLQLGVAFKQEMSITRGQKIDLGVQVDGLSVALVVKLTSEATEEVNILIQLYPLERLSFPAGVQLIVVDELGETVDEVTSREEDNWIQLELSAEFGENFSVTVAYKEANVTQDFVLDS